MEESTVFTAKPRQGYLFVVPIKNPWGEKVGAIDISPMHDATPGSWRIVTGIPDIAGEYEVGDAVYMDKNAAEPVIMGPATVGLVHESKIKACIPGGTFRMELVDSLTVNVLEQVNKARARQNAPALAVPVDGRRIEV